MKKTRKNHFYRTKIYSGKILKVRVDDVFLKKALSLIEEWVDPPNRRADSNKQYQITTPNSEHIVLAQDDYRFRKILNNSALVVPDGIGVVWAARLLKSGKGTSEVKKPGLPAVCSERREQKTDRVFKRLSGIDLMLAMCRLAARKRWRVFLLGGKKRAAESAALKLKIKYQIPKTPQHQSARVRQTKNSKTKTINNETTQSPASNGARKQWKNEFKIAYDEGSKSIINETTKEQQRIIKKINNFKPHFLFVAYGAPMQEKWVAKNLPKLKVKVGMGVGGAFDYLSGRVKRAPKIIQKLNLEWFWRLIHEPWRWRRQLRLVKFAWLVVGEKIRKKEKQLVEN